MIFCLWSILHKISTQGGHGWTQHLFCRKENCVPFWLPVWQSKIDKPQLPIRNAWSRRSHGGYIDVNKHIIADSMLNPILVLRQMKRKKKTMTATILMKNTLVSLQPKGYCITRSEIGHLLVVAVTLTIYLPQILPSRKDSGVPLSSYNSDKTSSHLPIFFNLSTIVETWQESTFNWHLPYNHTIALMAAGIITLLANSTDLIFIKNQFKRIAGKREP